MTGTWLPSLHANIPQEGHDLVVKQERVAVRTTQPDATTVAPANGVWRAR